MLVFAINVMGAPEPQKGCLLPRLGRGDVAMKRQNLLKLYAWLISFRSDSRIRRPTQDSTTETSPILLFVAVSLFLILAILEIDLHGAELRLLGFRGEGRIDPALKGP